jgi:hypothetical protein
LEDIRSDKEAVPMDMNEIHDYARRFLGTHGDKAAAEAAQKVVECEKMGEKTQAEDWRRIQAAIQQMRGPHAS